MNIDYLSIPQYLDSKKTISDKIKAYDALISSMEAAILEGIGSGHLAEYEMDDGQMKVRGRYRSIAEMTRAIKALEAMRQMYINRYNGRVTVLRGGNII